MRKFLSCENIFYLLVFCFVANSYALIRVFPVTLFIIVPLFLLINIFAGYFRFRKSDRRLKICYHGGILLGIFALSLAVSVTYHIVLAFFTIPGDHMTFIWSAVLCICVEAVLFWNGIICVYLTSYQLGIKLRLIGALCGMIPVANLMVLNRIIKTVLREVEFEAEKEKINSARTAERVCATKYPILLVHGVFFRDSKYINYWGRIPKELEKNGAKIFYGEHQSALSVADSAAELTARIKGIVNETGCEKLNIIAHSKGGLDCRYAISELDAAPYVASLTTVNTPHRGCLFADRLLGFAPRRLKDKVSHTYNTALKKLGDDAPDFMAAVSDLTAEACGIFDADLRAPEGIFCQSIGSKLNKATSGTFPLNLSYHLVKFFDGANDGLVGEESFRWGEKYTFLTIDGQRGISHGDMVDLNRENIDGFDVREFYVNLVNDLKNRGL